MAQWRETITAPRIDDEEAFEVNRDAFAKALEQSRWFRESEDHGDLWQLWDELKDAENVEHFDFCLDEIYDLADEDRIWITFDHVEPSLSTR